MTGDVRERPKLDLGLDDELDLSDFGTEEETPAKSKSPSAKEVEQVSKDAGFTSRSPTRTTLRRKRRKTSPFQIPLGIKTRAGMKEIFQELGDLLDTHDHTTFENALEALIKQTDNHDLMERFKQLKQAD